VIIFRKRKPLKNEIKGVKFLWGEKSVEIVDEYTYLGIPFNFRGTFDAAKKKFIEKAREAQKQIQILLNNTKSNKVCIRLKLFNSLVRSVLLYAAPIWAVYYLEELETFQTQFLRLLTNTCNLTPGNILRLETGAKPIKFLIFKQVIKFISKNLMNGNKNSLNMNCLNEIKKLQPDEKYNWWTQIRNIFKQVGLEAEFEQLDDNYIKSNITSLIGKAEQNCKNEDVVQMMSGHRLTHYKTLKTHANISEIYNKQVPWATIKVIQQMRFGHPRIRIGGELIELNEMNKLWDTGKTSACKTCQITENNYHVLLVCPIYSDVRPNIAMEGINNENYIPKLFHDSKCNEEFMQKIFDFWLKVAKIRKDLTERTEP
jgi:hypothetical protein